MKIIRTTIYEVGVDKDIREYGVRRLSRETGIPAAKISRAIRGVLPLPEEDWRRIIKVKGEFPED